MQASGRACLAMKTKQRGKVSIFSDSKKDLRNSRPMAFTRNGSLGGGSFLAALFECQCNSTKLCQDNPRPHRAIDRITCWVCKAITGPHPEIQVYDVNPITACPTEKMSKSQPFVTSVVIFSSSGSSSTVRTSKQSFLFEPAWPERECKRRRPHPGHRRSDRTMRRNPQEK